MRTSSHNDNLTTWQSEYDDIRKELFFSLCLYASLCRYVADENKVILLCSLKCQIPTRFLAGRETPGYLSLGMHRPKPNPKPESGYVPWVVLNGLLNLV